MYENDRRSPSWLRRIRRAHGCVQGDVSRYSESDGFLDDYHDRLLWPYRDWVIEAFNRNMPFNEFGTWQVAGDLLPSHSAAQKKRADSRDRLPARGQTNDGERCD